MEARWSGELPDAEEIYSNWEGELTPVELPWIEVAHATESSSFEIYWYFDTVKLALVSVIPELSMFGPPEEHWGDTDREQWELEQAIEENEDGRFLPLEERDTHSDYRRMERFILDIEPPEVADDFSRAIEGRGAFRSFRDQLWKYDLRDAWHEYDEAESMRRLHEWFASRGFRMTVVDPPRPPEQ